LNLSAQSIPQPDPALSEIIAQLQEKLARKDQAPSIQKQPARVQRYFHHPEVRYAA